MLGGVQDQDARTDRSSQINRIAWLVTFVVPLVLTALLLTVKTAQAEPVPSPVSLEEVFEAEIEETIEMTPEDACIEAEEAFEMEELIEEEVEEICEEESEDAPKGKDERDPGPRDCPIRSANAHASTNHTVEVKQAPSILATSQRPLAASWAVRFTKPLAENADGKLTVKVKLPA